jgi:thiamine-phosphate pyrophosphorylase
VDGERRRELLRDARLYFVTDGDVAVVREAIAGGVDLVQLRMKDSSDEEIVDAARAFREACPLLILNDRPDLARAVGADGVHLGQDDMSAQEARRIVGSDLLVGVSTHSREQIAAAEESEADYFAVGPVHETPTKPGRPAVGLDLVRHAAAARPRRPWFAIGGIDTENAAEVAAAGAGRVVVVRAIRNASDPRAAATALRTALDREAVGGAVH